jgi:hypothetical protein
MDIQYSLTIFADYALEAFCIAVVVFIFLDWWRNV